MWYVCTFSWFHSPRLLILRVPGGDCATFARRKRALVKRSNVCVRIPVCIPLRLPKHRIAGLNERRGRQQRRVPRKQDRVVEHAHLLPAPHLPPRTGRCGCGCSCALRATTCSCVACRPWPTAAEDSGVGLDVETCAFLQWGTARRRAGCREPISLRTSCNAPDLGCNTCKGRRASTPTVGSTSYGRTQLLVYHMFANHASTLMPSAVADLEGTRIWRGTRSGARGILSRASTRTHRCRGFREIAVARAVRAALPLHHRHVPLLKLSFTVHAHRCRCDSTGAHKWLCAGIGPAQCLWVTGCARAGPVSSHDCRFVRAGVSG
ncbi:hypothetical protein DFH08DRAFT_121440 [Mycena albidolilacea]|uniref:Uncharacterized protein n=1 Tax=Mycena albidolilacea TaxID=1033008 RepID=A0AAD7E6V7_9AGAR|nr:hypothetical protein DFH08DRAFT_121440 [Mycena albidolilacea]